MKYSAAMKNYEKYTATWEKAYDNTIQIQSER